MSKESVCFSVVIAANELHNALRSLGRCQTYNIDCDVQFSFTTSVRLFNVQTVIARQFLVKLVHYKYKA